MSTPWNLLAPVLVNTFFTVLALVTAASFLSSWIRIKRLKTLALAAAPAEALHQEMVRGATLQPAVASPKSDRALPLPRESEAQLLSGEHKTGSIVTDAGNGDCNQATDGSAGTFGNANASVAALHTTTTTTAAIPAAPAAQPQPQPSRGGPASQPSSALPDKAPPTPPSSPPPAPRRRVDELYEHLVGEQFEQYCEQQDDLSDPQDPMGPPTLGLGVAQARRQSHGSWHQDLAPAPILPGLLPQRPPSGARAPVAMLLAEMAGTTDSVLVSTGSSGNSSNGASTSSSNVSFATSCSGSSSGGDDAGESGACREGSSSIRPHAAVARGHPCAVLLQPQPQRDPHLQSLPHGQQLDLSAQGYRLLNRHAVQHYQQQERLLSMYAQKTENGSNEQPAVQRFTCRYVSRTRILRTAVKIHGVEPEQVAPGWQQRVARVVADSHLQLEAAYVCRGCCELIVDALLLIDPLPPPPPLPPGLHHHHEEHAAPPAGAPSAFRTLVASHTAAGPGLSESSDDEVEELGQVIVLPGIVPMSLASALTADPDIALGSGAPEASSEDEVAPASSGAAFLTASGVGTPSLRSLSWPRTSTGSEEESAEQLVVALTGRAAEHIDGGAAEAWGRVDGVPGADESTTAESDDQRMGLVRGRRCAESRGAVASARTATGAAAGPEGGSSVNLCSSSSCSGNSGMGSGRPSIDIGALIRALQLPYEGSIEYEMTYSLGEEEAATGTPYVPDGGDSAGAGDGAMYGSSMPLNDDAALAGDDDLATPGADRSSARGIRLSAEARLAAFQRQPAGMAVTDVSFAYGDAGDVGPYSTQDDTSYSACAIIAVKPRVLLMPSSLSHSPAQTLATAAAGATTGTAPNGGAWLGDEALGAAPAAAVDAFPAPRLLVDIWSFGGSPVSQSARNRPQVLVRSQGVCLPVQITWLGETPPSGTARTAATRQREAGATAAGAAATVGWRVGAGAGVERSPWDAGESAYISDPAAAAAAVVSRDPFTTFSTAEVQLLGLPPLPGLVLVEARQGEQVRSAVVPVLLLDDPRVCCELRDLAERWQGTSGELRDVLMDIGCFIHHVEAALRSLAPTQSAGAPAPSPSPSAPAAPSPSPSLGPGPAAAGTSYPLTRLLRARLVDLGSHLLSWFMEGSGAGAGVLEWPETVRWLQASVAAIGAAPTEDERLLYAGAAVPAAATPATAAAAAATTSAAAAPAPAAAAGAAPPAAGAGATRAAAREGAGATGAPAVLPDAILPGTAAGEGRSPSPGPQARPVRQPQNGQNRGRAGAGSIARPGSGSSAVSGWDLTARGGSSLEPSRVGLRTFGNSWLSSSVAEPQEEPVLPAEVVLRDGRGQNRSGGGGGGGGGGVQGDTSLNGDTEGSRSKADGDADPRTPGGAQARVAWRNWRTWTAERRPLIISDLLRWRHSRARDLPASGAEWGSSDASRRSRSSSSFYGSNVGCGGGEVPAASQLGSTTAEPDLPRYHLTRVGRAWAMAAAAVSTAAAAAAAGAARANLDSDQRPHLAGGLGEGQRERQGGAGGKERIGSTPLVMFRNALLGTIKSLYATGPVLPGAAWMWRRWRKGELAEDDGGAGGGFPWLCGRSAQGGGGGGDRTRESKEPHPGKQTQLAEQEGADGLLPDKAAEEAGYQALLGEYSATQMHWMYIFILACYAAIFVRAWADPTVAVAAVPVGTAVVASLSSLPTSPSQVHDHDHNLCLVATSSACYGGSSSATGSVEPCSPTDLAPVLAGSPGCISDSGTKPSVGAWAPSVVHELGPSFVAVLPALVTLVTWPLLSRPAWVRLVRACMLPRLLAHLAAGVLMAVLGLEQSHAVSAYHLGPAVFVGDGLLYLGTALVPVRTSALIGLLRVPVYVRMWGTMGAAFSPAYAWARAGLVSALAVATNVACHAYLRTAHRSSRMRKRPGPAAEGLPLSTAGRQDAGLAAAAAAKEGDGEDEAEKEEGAARDGAWTSQGSRAVKSQSGVC